MTTNILIPTLFESDTEHALKAAAELRPADAKQIVLLSISPLGDSITELLFTSSAAAVDLEKRNNILDFCNREFDKKFREKIKVDHQFGLSRPLMKNLLSKFEVGMVIVPRSFTRSKQFVHQFAMRLLHQSGCPMMLLPQDGIPHHGIQRALYLGDSHTAHIPAIQQYAFHVIHKSMIPEGESVKSIVKSMEIDLIVKGKRSAASNDFTDGSDEEFGLPVLAV